MKQFTINNIDFFGIKANVKFTGFLNGKPSQAWKGEASISIRTSEGDEFLQLYKKVSILEFKGETVIKPFTTSYKDKEGKFVNEAIHFIPLNIKEAIEKQLNVKAQTTVEVA